MEVRPIPVMSLQKEVMPFNKICEAHSQIVLSSSMAYALCLKYLEMLQNTKILPEGCCPSLPLSSSLWVLIVMPQNVYGNTNDVLAVLFANRLVSSLPRIQVCPGP